MKSKQIYLLKSLVLFILLLMGYLLPGREYLYPFIKFPMYGYSKTPSEMFQKHYNTVLYYEDHEGVVIDPFDYGYSRSYFKQTVVKPFISGDTTALDKLIKNSKLIYPNRRLYQVEVQQIHYEVSSIGLEIINQITLTKNVFEQTP